MYSGAWRKALRFRYHSPTLRGQRVAFFRGRAYNHHQARIPTSAISLLRTFHNLLNLIHCNRINQVAIILNSNMFAIQAAPKSSATETQPSTDRFTPNILPCKIHYDGPVKTLDRYWTPQADEQGKSVRHLGFAAACSLINSG